MRVLIHDDKIGEIATEAAKEAGDYPYKDALYQAAWQAVQRTIQEAIEIVDEYREQMSPKAEPFLFCDDCRGAILPWKPWYSPADDPPKRICPECWGKRKNVETEEKK